MRTISLLLLSAPLLALSVTAITDAEITTKTAACAAIDPSANEGDDKVICNYDLGEMEAKKKLEDARTAAQTALTAAQTKKVSDAEVDRLAASAASAEITKKDQECQTLNQATHATEKSACEAVLLGMRDPNAKTVRVAALKPGVEKDANDQKVTTDKQTHDDLVKKAGEQYESEVKALGVRPLTAAEKTAKTAVDKAHAHGLAAPLDAEFAHFEMKAAKKHGINTHGDLYVLLEAASKEKKAEDANKKKVAPIYADLVKTFEDKDLKKATGPSPADKFTDDERKSLKAAAEARKKVFAEVSSASALAAGGLAAAASAAVVFTLL